MTVLVQSQNVGIGTTTPTYPLTVQANGNGIVHTNGTVRIGLFVSNTTGGWLQTLSNHNLNLATNDASQPQATLATNGNFGIGIAAPAYKLDLNGRMRIQHNGQTAGIWFDGVGSDTRSFIGTIDNDHVGIWGAGGAGWKFAFNVNNGNLGIGTSTPSASLDVNGSIRMRGTFPKKGSVMTSDDANGNANWADPIAFKAIGGFDGSPNTLTHTTWTKVLFNQTASYNLGLAYQPLLSQFLVPENGVYHFDASIDWTESLVTSGIRLRLNRNGSLSTIAESMDYNISQSGIVLFQKVNTVSADASLQAGDVITIEGYAWIPSSSGSTTDISATSHKTFFNGHLVARQ